MNKIIGYDTDFLRRLELLVITILVITLGFDAVLIEDNWLYFIYIPTFIAIIGVIFLEYISRNRKEQLHMIASLLVLVIYLAFFAAPIYLFLKSRNIYVGSEIFILSLLFLTVGMFVLIVTKEKLVEIVFQKTNSSNP